MKQRELIDDLPMGLTRIVARILSRHAGKENSITKDEVKKRVEENGFREEKNLARKIRIAVRDLRRSGMVICSSSSGAGYWLATDYTEALEVICEMFSRGKDIMQTARALEEAAKEQFTPQPMRML